MIDGSVITTDASDRYHVDEDCWASRIVVARFRMPFTA